ncbi:50S ribosome-binding GTPase [Candidatus Woesearchaeota archaeon]|nr:50S ribosome-binding GTPase [Candidatus Woesearchaeota archaeon]
MNFQTLLRVEIADTYLDTAFRRAKDAVARLRAGQLHGLRLDKSRQVELERISAVRGSLTASLNGILHSFPSLDTLPPFYNELVKCSLEYPELKQALGAINWCSSRVSQFASIYADKIKQCRDLQVISRYRREYYGRAASILKQIADQLVYLEQARKTMKEFPTVKTSLFTASIFGFPNVGKTTLLMKLTGSSPEIKDYAFTTKTLNVGNMVANNQRIQIIDTPGTLNRFDKMNAIEKQAYLVNRHLAQMIVYVFDITEPFPLDKQIALYEQVKKGRTDVLIYLSKTDVLDKKMVDDFKKKYPIVSLEQIKQQLVKKATGFRPEEIPKKV